MNETAKREYMPQLDSLRAIAVFFVMLAHYSPYNKGGITAVRLFFVLSGFLITSLLLDARGSMETRGTTLSHELRVFFSRRFLRLYPPLLIAIGLGTLFAVNSLRTTWWWHVTYLSNVYFARRGDWEGALTPLWTLSVEEQFYLIWPFVILLVPYKRLVAAIVAIIMSAIAFNIAAFYLRLHWMPVLVLPFHSLDALGIGSLLAISWYRPDLSPISKGTFKTLGLIAGVAGFAALQVLYHFDRGLVVKAAFKDMFTAMIFMWIVASAASGFAGPVGAVLNLAALRIVGKISYGIYLYHNFVQGIVYWSWKKMGIPMHEGIPVGLIEWSHAVAGPYDTNLYKLIILCIRIMIAIGLASLSWFLVERPLSRLRKQIGTSDKSDSRSELKTILDGAPATSTLR